MGGSSVECIQLENFLLVNNIGFFLDLNQISCLLRQKIFIITGACFHALPIQNLILCRELLANGDNNSPCIILYMNILL